MKNKTFFRIIFAIYIIYILKLVVFRIPAFELFDGWDENVVVQGFSRANFVLFSTINKYINRLDNWHAFKNIVGNIVLFIPLGFFIPLVSKNTKRFIRTMFNSFLFILFIESAQLITNIGSFDVDDFLLNMIGALIGYLFIFIIRLLNGE